MRKCLSCTSRNFIVSKQFEFFDKYHCTKCDFWFYKRIPSCCRSSCLVVSVHQNKEGDYHLYKQCISCGGANTALRIENYANAIQTNFDLYRFNAWKEKVSTEHFNLARMKKEYYLHHTDWSQFQEIKNRKIIIDLNY